MPIVYQNFGMIFSLVKSVKVAILKTHQFGLLHTHIALSIQIAKFCQYQLRVVLPNLMLAHQSYPLYGMSIWIQPDMMLICQSDIPHFF